MGPIARLCLAVVAATLILTAAGCGGTRSVGSSDRAKADAHYGRAMAYIASAQPQMAAQELQDALKADPNMYQAYYQLGLIYQENRQPNVARQVWNTGVQRASVGPERDDYPRLRAVAEMRAALIGLDEANRRNAEISRTDQAVQQARELVKVEEEATVVAVAAQAAAPEPAPAPGGKWAVLFSSNLKKASAEGDIALLKAKGYDPAVDQVTIGKRAWYRVWAAGGMDKAAAMEMRDEVSRATGRKRLEVMVR